MDYEEAEKRATCISNEARNAAADRPFAQHDAKRNAQRAVLSATTLPGLLEKVRLMADRHTNSIHGIAGLLESHADAMHGPVEELDRRDKGAGSPHYGNGLLAELATALDVLDGNLDDAVSRLATQAGRNCTLV